MAKLARINKALHGRQENAASILRIKQTHIRHLQLHCSLTVATYCVTHTYTHATIIAFEASMERMVAQCPSYCFVRANTQGEKRGAGKGSVPLTNFLKRPQSQLFK